MSDRDADSTRRLFAKVRGERASERLRARVLAVGRAERARLVAARAEACSRGSGLRLVPPPEASGGPRRSLRSAVLGFGAFAAGVVGLLAVLSALRAPSAVSISAEAPGRMAPLAPSHARVESGSQLPRAEQAASSPADAVSPAAAETAPERAPEVAVEKRRGLAEREAPAKTDARPAASAPSPGAAAPAPDAPSSAAAPAAQTPAAAAPPAAPSLSEQLGRIKHAREMLRAGDPLGALSEVESYRREVADGAFAAEAALLGIEALAAAGRDDDAARAARSFAASYPTSPLIDRALGFTRPRAE